MSFFGFDTTLPRDRGGGVAGGGQQKNSSSDPFDPTKAKGASGLEEDDDDDDDAAFEEKVRNLRAGTQEDVEIYTWGGEGYDGLGDLLQEAGDDFNDDTFGMADVGKDFDFAGTGGAGAGVPQQQQQPMQQPQYDSRAFGQAQRRGNDAAFASTLDDFWMMPDVKPKSSASPFPKQAQTSEQDQQQQPSQRAPAQTLEEIEAELRSQRPQQQQQQQQPQQQQAAQPQPEKRGLTLEEVEAEMLARRSGAQQAPPQPPQLAALMSQAQSGGGAAAAAPRPASSHSPSASLQNINFPPLGSTPPPAAPPGSRAQMGTPPVNDQALHFARMKSLLEALPPPVQGRILALPPYMHFGAVDGISRQFPALLVAASPEKLPQQQEQPHLFPRYDGSPEEQATLRYMIDGAIGSIDDAERMERKRFIKLQKIQAMSRHNNCMTLSDKDFITRIQVSQLISADPYADDFYAHIFFALRGGKPGFTSQSKAVKKEGEASAATATAEQQETATPTTTAPVATTTNGKPTSRAAKQQQQRKQQQTNRRETAMQRMQQQVERIVQNRKERIEKSASGAALEGALGRVSISSSKNPRQMLQISGADVEKERAAEGDGKDKVGHAQNAVEQALKGASLGQGGGGGGVAGDESKRPALTKYEVLKILEQLYDVTMALEQTRRNAPAGARQPDAGEANDNKEAAEEEDAEVQAWKSSRDALVATLWKEMRVLEPLEISDPHPFISLLSTVKGKRLLPRALRHLSSEQTLTAMTMIVASFDSLDVIREAPILDTVSSGPHSAAHEDKKAEVRRQTDAFLASIVPCMLSLMATSPMQIVSGMLALFIERNNLARCAQTRPGVAFLTILLSRAESLRQSAGDAAAMQTPESDLAQRREIFDLLIQRLCANGRLPMLFPSTRLRASLPFGAAYLDGQVARKAEEEDEPVWNLMATLAVSATMDQQHILIRELREKILENVIAAKQQQAALGASSASTPGGEMAPPTDIRIRNVNLLLHALNLDATQIAV